MFNPSSPPGPSAPVVGGACRALTVAELLAVLQELDRVVIELQESLRDITLPLDADSHHAARAAIAAARRH